MLLDVNVLLALSWDEHVHHDAAHRNFARLEGWATTPITEAGLVRLLMTEAVTGSKVSGQDALSQLRAIRAAPGWTWMPDGSSLADAVIDDRVLMGRRQVTDLHLVNLAASHHTRLVTFDAGLVSSLTPADHGSVELWSA